MKPLSRYYHIKNILKLIGFIASWSLILVLSTLVLHSRDPLLLAYRSYETTFIIILSGILFTIIFRKAKGINKITSCICLTLIFILAVFNEASFHYRKQNVLNSSTTLGEHFIVGYKNIENLKPLVNKGLVGGLFITRHNVVGKTAAMIKKEIAELQQIRKQAGLPPLIIATDQEGGIVSHMSPPLTRMPALSSLIHPEDSLDNLISKANTYGQQQGQALAELGINVNFSPVVDLKPNRPKNNLDFHTLIEQRAISADPIITTKIAIAYGKGLLTKGVKPTFKHFPGLARVKEDTHHFSAILNTSITELEAQDWIPYKEIVKQPNILIMLSHVTLAQIDNKNPVSFSKKVVQRILRGKWQYQGILITDDLTMRAAYSHSICQASIKALNAGVDLLLISFDNEKFYDAMYCVQKAYNNHRLDKEKLQISQQRLINFRQQ